MPSEAPYTAVESPPGPDPTTSRSKLVDGTLGAGSPTAAASWALLGLRSSLPCTITIGVSAGATPSWLSSASAPGSVSRSSQRDGIRLRAAKSRSLRVSDRKSTRLNSSHVEISYADFCLKKNIGGRCILHQQTPGPCAETLRRKAQRARGRTRGH